MDKQTVFKFFKGVGKNVSKHSPEILTAIGVVGMITTTVLAVKATPKALEKIEEKKEELNLEPADNLTTVETVKAAWKPYIPAVVTGVFATGCLIAANSVHAKRYAGLATAYQISTTALNEYREKVVETIGEKKERVVHDKIAEDRVKKNPPETQEVYVVEGNKTLTYDVLSGRYFMSDRSLIERVQHELNRKMDRGIEHSISLNEFYTEIGLPQIPVGNQVGWAIGTNNDMIDIYFSSTLTEQGPCMTIEHLVPPEYDFYKIRR